MNFFNMYLSINLSMLRTLLYGGANVAPIRQVLSNK